MSVCLAGWVCQENVCFRNWRASWERICTEWDYQANLAQKEKASAGRSMALILWYLPPPYLIQYPHIRGPGRRETPNTKKVVFSLKKKIWLANLYFSHCSLHTSWLVQLLWDSLFPWVAGFGSLIWPNPATQGNKASAFGFCVQVIGMK